MDLRKKRTKSSFEYESFRVDGGRLALGNVCFNHIANPEAGIHEDQFRQFSGVDSRYSLSNFSGRLVEKLSDQMNLRRGPFSRRSDSLKNEQHPRFPCLSGRDFKQIPVVQRPVTDDVSTEIEDGNVENALVDEIEQVQHASGPAVSVDKQVDCLKLIMHDGKPVQWVDLLGLVNVTLPVGQFASENVLSIGRHVNDLVGCIVFQRCSPRLANVQIHTLDRSTGFDRHGCRNGRCFSISKPRDKAVR